jgi:hypothetical protein
MWYLIIGVIWAAWLEWFSTTELEYPYNVDWKWKERVFNIVLWPLAFGVFLYNYFRF